TDSFHGTVFSILFQKQFSIFIRTDNDVPMNSRIETLVDKFEVRDRLAAQMDVDSAMKPIDYKKIEEILVSERKKSQEYLHEISKMW
ncbi:MAG: polysaccharide pyruvyl transferase family protein, partial [Lachnospiraceae bacterium]|nr:polysaccharide pyruvyl transferase family protein [Lachnospiraceae bacterium]